MLFPYNWVLVVSSPTTHVSAVATTYMVTEVSSYGRRVKSWGYCNSAKKLLVLFFRIHEKTLPLPKFEI